MRYLLRETTEEIDLKTNAPDNPSCPRCGNYNALLSKYDRAIADSDRELLVCRDCGCEVIVCAEPDISTLAREFVENASDQAIKDASAHLAFVHGRDFSTAKEAATMYADVDYAREILYNTSYTETLFSYFTGYVEGGAQGSSAFKAIAAGISQKTYRGGLDFSNPEVLGEPDPLICRECGTESDNGILHHGIGCANTSAADYPPNSDFGANKGTY